MFDNSSFLLKASKSVCRISPLARKVSCAIVVNYKESIMTQIDLTSNSIVILPSLLVIFAILYYFLKRNKYLVRKIMRTQYVSLELNENALQISLFHRHQKDADKIINITDLVSSEVRLNDKPINVINAQAEHGFNTDIEQDLYTAFANEKINKMVDDKVRRISLLLTDKNKSSYTICLYLRKGDSRMTKKPYSMVIDELVDWSWLLSETINADNTEKRKIKQSVISQQKQEYVKSKEYCEASVSNYPEKPSTINVADTAMKEAENTNKDNRLELELLDENSVIDTDLVDGLEKLVLLKQQGYLTIEEFSKAKETLLNTLYENKG